LDLNLARKEALNANEHINGCYVALSFTNFIPPCTKITWNIISQIAQLKAEEYIPFGTVVKLKNIKIHRHGISN
jgi:hypothetical protein